MKMPSFDGWTPWAARSEIDHCDQPGVYLLGRFEASPPGTVDPVSERVICIGETCDQTLKKRWDQFGRTGSPASSTTAAWESW
jgi:hypothetical protein